MRNHRMSTAWIGVALIVVGGTLSAGCATKGFVRNYVEGQTAPQREAITRLDGDVAAVRVTADSANARSLAAEQSARLAMDEAAAARRLASKIASGELKYNVVQSNEIRFAFNKFALDEVSTAKLDELATLLEQHPRYVLEITGNTDNVGSSRYNLHLGEERAETVRRYLNDAHHVPLAKMATISFGSGKPVAHGEGASVRALNRRAEIRVLEIQDTDLAAVARAE
ncbi:MAG: OmpA family protein [Candidatus Eisenbacteria bacterium]|nr:OmpA family protein [Candidatus Eisenbacteria bacterium]